MTEKQKDDIYYVCSLIEFIARKTKNHRQDVIRYFSEKRYPETASACRSEPLSFL